MAVYQGARPRGMIRPLGDGPIAVPALPRRRSRPRTRLRRGRIPVGGLLAGIVFVFVLGFFSLVQAVRVSASNYEVDRLTTDRERLESRQRELQSDLNRLSSEPAVRKLALDAGLGQLVAPIVLPAR